MQVLERAGDCGSIRSNRFDRIQFLQRSPAASAMVPAWLDRAPLTAVDHSALPAAPRKTGQCEDLLLKPMIDRDGQFAAAVHLVHLAQEILPVIRAPFENVELPLMNHLMRNGANEFVFSVRCAGQQRLEQGKRKTDFPWRGLMGSTAGPTGTGTGMAHEHADRRGEPSTPGEIDRRECSIEIAQIEISPDAGELLRTQGKCGA